MRAPNKRTSKLSEAGKALRAAGRALFIIAFIVLTVAVQVIWIAVIVWFLFRLFRYVALALLVGTALGAGMALQAPPSRPLPAANGNFAREIFCEVGDENRHQLSCDTQSRQRRRCTKVPAACLAKPSYTI
jgi:hypothetical protein